MKFLILITLLLTMSCGQNQESKINTDMEDGANIEISIDKKDVGKTGVIIVMAEVDDETYIYNNESWFNFEGDESYCDHGYECNAGYIGYERTFSKTEKLFIPVNFFPSPDDTDNFKITVGYLVDGVLKIDKVLSGVPMFRGGE